MTESVIDRCAFASSHEALAFAYRYVGYPATPLMNRLAGGARSDGDGPHGVDGAGQAGMILSRLECLPQLHRAVLRARYGPMTRECRCCGQPAPHHGFVSAIRMISSDAAALFTQMPSVSEALIYALVARHFGKDRTALEVIGSSCGTSLSTVSRANGEIAIWLRGRRKGRGGQPGKQGVEAVAFAEADALLSGAGFIEC